MGFQQQQDRLSQSEFKEVYDALDISGSVALNVRQPTPAHAAAASGQADSAKPDVVKAQQEQNSSSAAAANTQEGTTASAAEAAPETQATESQPKDGTEAEKKGDNSTSPAAAAAPSAAPSAAAATAPPAAPSAPPAPPGSEVATLQQILRTKDCSLALVSDVDEQLLLNISFKQPIRLASFSILATTAPQGFQTNADDEDSVSAPMVVKVYCNKSALNFCGVVDEACAFSVLLSADDVLTGRRIALPGSKFHMCSSAQFFIQENQTGSAYTFLNRLMFYGVAHKRYS